MVRTVSLKNFDYASRTDRGKVRDRNEDFLSYFDTQNGHVFVVCDGMGGHSSGDVASELGTESIGKFLSESYYSNPFEAVESSIFYANQMVYNHSLGNEFLKGMGTTIVLVLIRNDRVYYGHAGDSRIYTYKNNILDQATIDHSYVQTLLQKGLVSKKDAENHPRKNEITCALGLSKKFDPYISPKAIIPQNDDILMLCTDGLTNLLSDDEIANILNNPYSLNDKATKLVSKANKNGGTDNISVQLIRFHNLNYIENEVDKWRERSLMANIRQLLKSRSFTYFLVSIFTLATILLFVGNDTTITKINENNEIHSSNEFSSDLIIPYKLEEGEGIEEIANRFNIEVNVLFRLNPNYEMIGAGKHLKIPVQNLHIVQKAEELPIISAKYNVDILDIMKANNLRSMRLIIGAELIIPLKAKN